MKEPSQDFRFLIKLSVQELFNMKKSSQEVLNQRIETGLSFQCTGIQLGIPYKKGSSQFFFLKQNWSGISATQKQNSFQNADIQLGILKNTKKCFPFDLQEPSEEFVKQNIRGGNSCDTKAIQFGIQSKIKDYIIFRNSFCNAGIYQESF